jgi:hypothetical protein
MHALYILKQKIDNGEECKELLNNCIEQFKSSKQNIRGLNTLELRYNINIDNTEEIKQILLHRELMRRDYLSCLDYFLKKEGTDISVFEYIYSNIKEIEAKDIDLMIENNWITLIKKFDGYMIECSYNSNITLEDKSKLRKYNFNISKMKDKYIDRIKNLDEVDHLYHDVDVLIDGANMSHLKGYFDFSILPYFISSFKKLNMKPKIVLHERHVITNDLLLPYLIRTPTLRNDDDYLIYGMLKYNILVLSNDMFRDHLKDMDLYIKCYVKSMMIKFYNNKLIIPKFSKCIQVNEDCIYIPCKNGFYKINY